MFSSSAFAELPKIEKHTSRVVKAPSGAKVLYRAKIAEASDSEVKVKWFVNAKKKCDRVNCIIKAADRAGEKKKSTY